MGDVSQLLKNVAYRFRYGLLAVGILALLAVGTIAVSSRRQAEREAAAERQERLRNAALAEESKRIADERQYAEDRRKAEQAEQRRLKDEDHARYLEKQKQDEQAAQKAELEKTQRFVARYLRSTSSLKIPGRGPAIAVALSGAEGRIDQQVGNAVSLLIGRSGIRASSSVFTPAFVEDGVLDRVRRSEGSDASALNLAALADQLLLGGYRVSVTQNPELEGVFTARLHFDADLVETRSGSVLDSVVLDVTGTGFTTDAATASAKKLLLTQLSGHDWSFPGR